MCFDLHWLEQIFILIVVICVIVALLQLLMRAVLPRITSPLAQQIIGFVIQAGWIVFWGVIAIAAIVFVFDLISCVWSYVSVPSLMPRR